MVKINVAKLVYGLVPQFRNYTKLINYIYSVQKTRTARLDFSAAAKVLGVDWKTVKRLCDKLAKIEIIYYEGDGLRLDSEAMTG